MTFIKQLLVLSSFFYLLIQGVSIVTKFPSITSLQNAEHYDPQNLHIQKNENNSYVQNGEQMKDVNKNNLDKNVRKSKSEKRMPTVPTSELIAIHWQSPTTNIVELVSLEDIRDLRKEKLKARKLILTRKNSTSNNRRNKSFEHNKNLPAEANVGTKNPDDQLVENVIQGNVEGIGCVRHCLQVLDDYLIDKTKYEYKNFVKENVASESIMENRKKNINQNNHENKIVNNADHSNEHCIDLKQFDKCIVRCQNAHFFVVLEELTNVLPAILQIAYKCDHKWVEKSNTLKSESKKQKLTQKADERVPDQPSEKLSKSHWKPQDQSQANDKLSHKQSGSDVNLIEKPDDKEDNNDLKPDLHLSNKDHNLDSVYKNINSLPVQEPEQSDKFSTRDILGEAAEVEQLILVQENNDDLKNVENNDNHENHKIQIFTAITSIHRDPVEIEYSKNDNLNLKDHLTQPESKVETEGSHDFYQNHPRNIANGEEKVPLNRHGEI